MTFIKRIFSPWEGALKFLYEERKGDIASLDGMRAVGMFAVFFGHSLYAMKLIPGFTESGASVYVENLASAVDLFFVMSGYLIYNILKAEYERKGRVDFLKFYKRRALRIFPAYYFFLIMSTLFLVLSLLGAGGRTNTEELKKYLYPLLWNYLYLGDYFPNPGHLWTLSVEFHWYLILPFLAVYVLFKLNHAKRVALLIVLIMIPPLLRAMHLYGILPYRGDDLFSWTYVAFHTRFDTLVAGVLVAEVEWFRKKDKHVIINWMRWILIALLIIPAHLINREEVNFSAIVLRYSLLVFGLSLFMGRGLVAGSLTDRIFSIKLLRPLARISYTVYLWHLVIGVFAMSPLSLVYKRQGYITWGDFIPYFIFGFIVTSLICTVFYMVIEYPFMRRRKKI